jgi:hypothetical protein
MYCIRKSLILNRKHPSYINHLKKFNIEKILYKNGIFLLFLGKSNNSRYNIKNNFNNYFNSFYGSTYATPEYYKKNFKNIEFNILFKCESRYKDIALKSCKYIINIKKSNTYILNLKNISEDLVEMYNTKYNCLFFHYGRHNLFNDKLSLYIDIYPFAQYKNISVLNNMYPISEIKKHVKNIIKNNVEYHV